MHLIIHVCTFIHLFTLVYNIKQYKMKLDGALLIILWLTTDREQTN